MSTCAESALYRTALAWVRVAYSKNSPIIERITDRMRAPVPGDLVIEATSFQPDPDRLGVLVRIEKDPLGERVWIIRTLQGEVKIWRNARFLAVPGNFKEDE